ncbi:MAG: response regulator [Syntrophothermus sp.]
MNNISTGRKTVRILIAEDSNTQREQLKYVLEKNSYIVDSARDGREALELLKQGEPDLVLSDIVMPDMDGYELCSAIKAAPAYKHIPVILLTNLSDPHDVIKGLQAGADNFITKPYEEKFLLSRINYVLINKEMRSSSPSSGNGIEIVFGGERYSINSGRMQIVDLLLSTYENAIQKNNELINSNRKLVEVHRELEQKNRELLKLNEEKNKFLRIAAHDLRNPVGSALAFSYFLKEEAFHKLSDEEKSYVNNIQTSNEYCLQLLNELLDIAVIESGKLNLNISEIDFVSLLKKNLALNKVLAEKKNISLRLITAFENRKLKIDPVKIEQVLNNLISNALKFSHSGTRVEVRFSLDNEERAIIAVQDSGQGIPAEEIGNLFKPFQKTSVRSTADERSTGLGLSIVHKIIEAHNGKVWVESTVGRGSTFYFTLPLV